MALDDLALAEWLKAAAAEAPGGLGVVPFEVGPHLKEYAQADIAGVVTRVGGFGLQNEGIFDVPQFQVRVRAREHKLPELLKTVQHIDRKIILEAHHAEMWGTWVVVAGRSGSGPTPLEEDTRERRSFVCTYFAKVEL